MAGTYSLYKVLNKPVLFISGLDADLFLVLKGDRKKSFGLLKELDFMMFSKKYFHISVLWCKIL